MDKDNKLLVSIIIPVYMVEEYIQECVDSVVNQTYRNLEIILVDDGGTDNCPAICDEYANDDTRVKVVHKSNGGLSDARNVGLDTMTGDVVFFLDSDDWIEKDAIERMVYAFVGSGAQLVSCGVRNVYADGHADRFNGEKEGILTKEEAVTELIKGISITCIACNKLYASTLFDDIRYPIGKIHEDEYVIHRLLLKCEKIYCLNRILYNYRRREGSITSLRKNGKSFLCEIEALGDREKILRENGFDELADEISCGLILRCYDYAFKIEGVGSFRRDLLVKRQIEETVKKSGYRIMNRKCHTIKQHFKILVKSKMLAVITSAF